jgi:hypothetical protein
MQLENCYQILRGTAAPDDIAAHSRSTAARTDTSISQLKFYQRKFRSGKLLSLLGYSRAYFTNWMYAEVYEWVDQDQTLESPQT